MTQKELVNLKVGDKVLLGNNQIGKVVKVATVNKPEVKLNITDGKPRFSSPYYRSYEILKKIEPMIKFEEVNLEELKIEDISIKNLKFTKKKSECDVYVNNHKVEDKHIIIMEELKKDEMLKRVVADIIAVRDKILAGRSDMEERLNKIEEDRKKDTPEEPKVSEEKNREIDKLTKDAKPMLRESAEGTVIRLGLTRGKIASRTNAYDKDCGYGVLTGEFTEVGDGILIHFTDRSTFLLDYVSLITDVNKDVFRMLKIEKERLEFDKNAFIDQINMTIENIIFD